MFAVALPANAQQGPALPPQPPGIIWTGMPTIPAIPLYTPNTTIYVNHPPLLPGSYIPLSPGLTPGPGNGVVVITTYTPGPLVPNGVNNPPPIRQPTRPFEYVVPLPVNPPNNGGVQGGGTQGGAP